ncbi:Coiled-coil domain-containing protein 86 [Aphelenchoides bicaudatus]|nr:Coiled-coil domain-containing protein 86 [Aphelenchoides bicaudatus]
MVSTRRTKRNSDGGPIKTKPSGEEKMDTTGPPAGIQKNKSNRFWKKKQTAPHFGTVRTKKVKPLHTKWAKKMKLKADLQQVKAKQSEIREVLQAEKQAKAERRKENEERRKANIEKNEIVQVIRNTDKLKKMNRKQLRMIKKKDTERMLKK